MDKNMKPEKDKQAKPPATNRVPRKPVVLVTILLIAAIGGYLIHSHDKSNKPASSAAQYEKGPHNQDYSKLDYFKLDGVKPGAGIGFEKPAAYVKALEATNKSQASFSHTLKSPVFAPLGALHVMSSAAGFDTSIYKTMLKKDLTNPKTDSYKTTATPVKEFLTTRFSPLYDVNFSDAKLINTTNLNGNAWGFDFSAAPKKSVSAPAVSTNPDPNATVDTQHAKPLPPKPTASAFENYKGQVFFIVGKRTLYYFAIYNTTYNWDNNSSNFAKVINSLKIDQ